ncbi:MAG: PAS domain S-box protein, partial [Janthinobacterium lividum]
MSGLPSDFLAGGGEMGALMRTRDWSATPIGPPGDWSQALRTAVRLALSSRHPMFIWWGPQLIQFYNDAYSQTMGPEKHPAALGGSGHDWWPEAWSIIGPQIEGVMSGGPATWHEDEVVPIRRHGSDEAVYWTYGFSPIDDETAPHGIGGVLVVCRDVTEEHRLRAALANERAEERRRRLTIESAIDYAIIVLDLDGLVTDWNTGAERVLGWSAEEMRGCPTDRFFTLKDQAENRSSTEMQHTLESGSASAECRYLRRDGSEFWASGEMMLMKDEAGTHLGFTKILRDITGRKQAEATLQAFNATLERQVEERTRERDQLWRMPNLLLAIAGFDATIRAVNPAWTTLLGWSEGELVGQCYADFIHPDDAQRSLDWAVRYAAGEKVDDLENRYRRKEGGYIPIGWTITVGDGVFHCTGRDVSGEKEQAAARVGLEEQLRQSQKMEAVGQLTGGLAHDFNNLLTGVTGSLELMQTRIAQGRIKDVDRYVNAAQGAAKRAAALTHRLLAFSRQQTLDPKPTDVDRLVTGMEDMIRRT